MVSLLHAGGLRLPASWLVPCTSSSSYGREEEEQVDSPGVRDRPTWASVRVRTFTVRSTNFSPALRHGCVCWGRCAAGGGGLGSNESDTRFLSRFCRLFLYSSFFSHHPICARPPSAVRHHRCKIGSTNRPGGRELLERRGREEKPESCRRHKTETTPIRRRP